jgi:hypothetical protein
LALDGGLIALWIGYRSLEKRRPELERYEPQHRAEGRVVKNFEAMTADKSKERWKAAPLLTVDGCLMTVGLFLAFGLLLTLAYYFVESVTD